jgi:hypothetical protein
MESAPFLGFVDTAAPHVFERFYNEAVTHLLSTAHAEYLREKCPRRNFESGSAWLRALRNEVTSWPAPGSEDTELGVLMELEVGHGETEVYPRVQA